MRLGGRMQAAAEILADIQTRHRPVPEALRDWGQAHRFAGSGDRAAISNLVLDVLRRKQSHAWLMDSDAAADLVVAALVRQWGYQIDALIEELRDDRFAPELRDPQQLYDQLSRDLDEAPEFIRADCPEWVVEECKSAFGDAWIAELQALAERAPLDLRINGLKANRDKVLKSLRTPAAGATALAPHGIRIPAPEGPRRQIAATNEVAFAKGWFEVQDEGSQLAAAMTGAQAGEQILDFCAGAGGKTLAMAAAMRNRGQIHAYDVDRHRMAPMVERLRRAGARNVQLVENADALAALQGRMDRVLVDAPCTGTGTWRRRPDAKWRLSSDTLAQRQGEQDAVLDAAALHVRPGGTLTYVTCSVLPSENGDRAAAFAARHPQFTICDSAAQWHSVVPEGSPVPEGPTAADLLLSPHRTATDGFYIVQFQRAGA
ncbi:RsmB/NOP family class I SAM-dependent RNA methyltransferase [Pseudohoeflea coraliihabitans]|uniref:RsmB/NOP family class I SAM-dependent RNA methyltransferase n=1 Tax=Pseudohoeflea coraliihabitans TaxID=2860393 RepID=A0ABS6WVD7_9HYPH|nr:RsmB/NOP family class I SAM-dependent RNA methyltransferase [Pseudohoeflea sp. DP4N28-3]MBW3099059.1 RsmB/NOP family class I SAM-dependent RNA methyltransferase [Pseudohoeflea sp. DP4N28-3]